MRRGLFTFVACTFIASCGGPSTLPPKTTEQAALLPDVRTASGRPPVVLVIREGDPAGAIGISVTTSGLTWSGGGSDDPEPAVALAGLLEGRLRAKAADFIVTPSYSGLRASLLVTNEADATRLAAMLRDVFTAPATEADLAPARRKLVALGQRPLPDRALTRWARCVGQPYSLAPRTEKEYGELDLARLERWRRASLGLGRVAIAVTAPPAMSDSVADSILRGPSWNRGAALPQGAAEDGPDVDVVEAPAGTASIALHLTLDVGTSSAAVTTAEALGDPHGPLAARLAELELPFHLREVTGAAHTNGGCVGVVLDAPSPSAPATDLATRVADATALVRLEAAVFLAERGAARDGRVLARRAGDARDASERAAWWALVDQGPAPRAGKGSMVLTVPSRRKTKDDPLEPTREALATAVGRRGVLWEQPVVEGRTRVEAGQGEAWVLVGSPCGTEAETETDSGLTAIFTAAAANGSTLIGDVRIEPWVATDGAGLLVHGPAIPGETPAAHARRLADTAARHFAAEPVATAALGRARTDLLQNDARSDGSVLSVLASALAPHHPSWVMPWGSSEPLARSSDAAVLLRAQALRSGPVRIAVLANVDASQGDAAVRAADRWVARRGDTRVCRGASSAEPSKPGTYAAPQRPGSMPEAYLAYPFPAHDETANDAANVVAAALSGSDGSLLERAFGGTVTAEASARVLGWPAAPALVVRVAAAQSALDSAVMQARALVDRLQKGAVPTADLDRAFALRTRSSMVRSLDPRARIVDIWRETSARRPAASATRDDVRAYTQRYLAEDAMIVVVSRPGRPAASP